MCARNLVTNSMCQARLKPMLAFTVAQEDDFDWREGGRGEGGDNNNQCQLARNFYLKSLGLGGDCPIAFHLPIPMNNVTYYYNPLLS